MHSLTVFFLATILALALTPAPQSQKKSPPKEKEGCGTVVPLSQLEAELASRAESASKNIAPTVIAPPTQAPYYLPLKIHMVRGSSGNQPGLSSEQLGKTLQYLNQIWKQVGIQFFIYGDVDADILNDDFFNLPDTEFSREALRSVNNVPNTINVYLTNLLGNFAGYGSFTTDNTQGILLNYQTFINPTDNRGLELFAHEMGHYFDLYHTHETMFGVECPSGNNGSTAGDLLGDTPADPGLIDYDRRTYRVDANCVYNNSAATPANCDTTPYKPPTRNLMSYSRGVCLTEFTSLQISKILDTLQNKGNRKNLINSKTRYVDRLASDSNTSCAYGVPCRTLEKALQAANNGDFIFLKQGTYPASSIGGKRLTLNRWGWEPNTGVLLAP